MQDFSPQNLRYAKLVDQYSRYIESPVLRLKFLNCALNHNPTRSRWIKLAWLGELHQRAMVIAELSKVLPSNKPVPMGIRMTQLLYRFRIPVYAACVAGTLIAGAGVLYAAARVVNTLSVSTEARETGKLNPSAEKSLGSAVNAIPSEAALTLDKVWLAERGDGYEFYSNGARVLTEFETDGPRRRFYRFDLEKLAAGVEPSEPLSQPAGIVYHISESDLLPFSGGYNNRLQTHSKALLEYATAHRLYNYVIDRFGRTYRIVKDESASSHAGNSIWSDGRHFFVNLSASFIGICFEGNSGGRSAVGADGINEAQVYAARVLTAVLRSKHGIEDANCVTHGLVSINPANRLMGYHTDWVSAFPFEALGLSSKYETELWPVSRLGFSYDQAYVTAAGGRKWPGLARADAALEDSAVRSGVSLEEQRRRLSLLFQQAFNQQRDLEKRTTLAE